jgi:hypothetical protein
MAEQAPTIEQRLGAILNPAPAPAEKATAAPQAAPAQEADDDYKPSTAGALEGDQAAPDEPAEAAGGEGPATWMPERLEDIAEAGGWDIADLYKIKIKVNGPDGRPVEVPIGEWKDSYQQSAQLDAIRRAERESHERAEAERQKAFGELSQRTVEIQGLAEAAMSRLMSKYQGTNWEQLRVLDPAEWSAKRAEMQEEFSHIQNIRQQSLNALVGQWQQQQAEQAKNYEKYLVDQDSEARRLIPELNDAEKAPQWKNSMVKWMRSNGFNDYEMTAVSNSAKLLDAVRTKMSLASAGTDAKKVSPSPKKFLRPGVAQQRGSKEAEAYKSARGKLRKSGSLNDATEVFKRILGG